MRSSNLKVLICWSLEPHSRFPNNSAQSKVQSPKSKVWFAKLDFGHLAERESAAFFVIATRLLVSTLDVGLWTLDCEPE